MYFVLKILKILFTLFRSTGFKDFKKSTSSWRFYYKLLQRCTEP